MDETKTFKPDVLATDSAEYLVWGRSVPVIVLTVTFPTSFFLFL